MQKMLNRLCISIVLLASFHINAIDMNYMRELTGNQKNLIPVLVLGSGVAGLSAAIYTARAQLHTVVMAGNEPGGQLMGSTLVENMPGVLAVPGYKVISSIEKQARELDVIIFNDTVQVIEHDESKGYFKVITENGRILYALSLVIATGASPNKLHIPGEKEYANAGVFTCAVCDCRQATGKKVVVVGGGDSAIEAVMHLAPYAKEITLLVRAGQMRASYAMQEKLRKYEHVDIQFHKKIIEILGQANEIEPCVSHVILQDTLSHKIEKIAAECVFVAIGHTPNSSIFSQLITMDDQGYISLQGRSQKTTIPGIFAAGDVADPIYKQAGKASGDGIAAGLDAIAYLHSQGLSVTAAQELSACYFRNEIENN